MKITVETGRAVFRLVHFARAEAVQQRAHNAPHMRVVVDDEKTQPVEIDTNHTPRPPGILPSPPTRKGKWAP